MLMVSALAACGQGAMVFDQQSATNQTGSGADYPFQAEQPSGQSFTPVLSSIGFVQFEFLDPQPGNGTGATVYVSLRGGSLSGPILGSTDPVAMPDGFSLGVANFIFGTPVSVTPGQIYFLQPMLQSGENGWTMLAGPFGYPGGTFFEFGSPDPNGYDAWFREGVLIPEPSCGLLVLAGAAGLWAAGSGSERSFSTIQHDSATAKDGRNQRRQSSAETLF